MKAEEAKILLFYNLIFRRHQSSFDGILEFPHIARPVIRLKKHEWIFANPRNRFVGRLSKPLQKIMKQEWDIFPPVAESGVRLIPFDIKGRTSKGNGESNETYASSRVPSKRTNPLPINYCRNRCRLP